MSLRNTLKRIRKNMGQRNDMTLLEALIVVLGVVSAAAVVGYYLLF